MPEEEIEGLSARQKVAILMIALGQETTAEVMKYLSDYEIEQIAQSITELDVVTTEQEDEVLEEFEQLLVAGKYVSQGGIDFARGALEKALVPPSKTSPAARLPARSLSVRLNIARPASFTRITFPARSKIMTGSGERSVRAL